MLSKKSRASSYIAARISGVICGNFAVSKVLPARLPTPSHCAPKPSKSARERGSASSRFTCALQHGWFVQLARVGQGGQLGIGHGRPEQIRQAGGELIVIQRHDWLPRFRLAGGRDEEELRGNKDRLEHQAQRRRGRRAGLARARSKTCSKDIQFRLRRGPAIGTAGRASRATLLADSALIACQAGGIRQKCAVRSAVGGASGGTENARQHFIGDAEILLRSAAAKGYSDSLRQRLHPAAPGRSRDRRRRGRAACCHTPPWSGGG